MMGNLAVLFEEITRCTGKPKCWGEKNPKCRKPVVLPCKQPKVMIITEQMNVSGKEMEKVREDWDPSKDLLNLIREAKEKKKRIGIIPKINDLFDGKFLQDFDINAMSFNRFYWTHFIKCPGNLRDRNFKGRGVVKEVCADTFLLKEIRELRPELIVCLGGYASRWILTPVKWTDMLLKELEWVIKGETQIPEREIQACGHQAKIVVLPHPSGRNPLATTLNEKLKTLLSL
jgi:hypothetical protein